MSYVNKSEISEYETVLANIDEHYAVNIMTPTINFESSDKLYCIDTMGFQKKNIDISKIKRGVTNSSMKTTFWQSIGLKRSCTSFLGADEDNTIAHCNMIEVVSM